MAAAATPLAARPAVPLFPLSHCDLVMQPPAHTRVRSCTDTHSHWIRFPTPPSICTQRQQQPAAVVPLFLEPTCSPPHAAAPPSSRWLVETMGERERRHALLPRALCSLLRRSAVCATATDRPDRSRISRSQPLRVRPVPRPSPASLRHGCPSRAHHARAQQKQSRPFSQRRCSNKTSSG